jgi:hypothetical protein
MASIDRVSVKAEAVGTLDCDIKNFADAIPCRLEDDDFVRSGAAHQTRNVCFAWAFTQNFTRVPTSFSFARRVEALTISSRS